MTAVYEWLMTSRQAATVDGFDRHVFACAIAAGLGQADRPLGQALGLDGTQLESLLGRYFPTALWVIGSQLHDAGEMAIEEEDLRDLLLRHRSVGRDEETWLAAIVARRSLESNHLWQDLGLHSRTDLSGLLTRNFDDLARKNTGDMKWKKFFYRALCEDEGLRLCKSPNCEICDDHPVCFGPETAASLPYAAL